MRSALVVGRFRNPRHVLAVLRYEESRQPSKLFSVIPRSPPVLPHRLLRFSSDFLANFPPVQRCQTAFLRVSAASRALSLAAEFTNPRAATLAVIRVGFYFFLTRVLTLFEKTACCLFMHVV